MDIGVIGTGRSGVGIKLLIEQAVNLGEMFRGSILVLKNLETSNSMAKIGEYKHKI